MKMPIMPPLPPEANVKIMGRFAYLNFRSEMPNKARLLADWDAYFSLSTPAGRAALASYVADVLLEMWFVSPDSRVNSEEWLWFDANHSFLSRWREEWFTYGNWR